MSVCIFPGTQGGRQAGLGQPEYLYLPTTYLLTVSMTKFRITNDKVFRHSGGKHGKWLVSYYQNICMCDFSGLDCRLRLAMRFGVVMS